MRVPQAIHPVAFAVLLSTSPLAARVGLDDACPAVCTPSGAEVAPVGTSCATVMFTPLTGTAGKATAECVATCSVCELPVLLEWFCNACPNGCTWIWENRSYDESGSAMTILSGTGTGTGRVTQKLTTSCNGPAAQFGISIEGTLRVYNLTCPCGP